MVQCGRTVLAGQYHVVVQELVVVQATSTIQAACVTVTYVFIKATEYGALCLTSQSAGKCRSPSNVW